MEVSNKERKLRIPESFNLFGQTFKVNFKKNLMKDMGYYGVSYFDVNLIELQEPNEELSVEQVEVTFLHELMHMVLQNAHYDKESKNEKFVDTIANLLHQFFKSSKYGKKNDNSVKYSA